MTNSIVQTLFLVHTVFLIIFQQNFDVTTAAPQGSIFPGKFTWGYLRDILGPENRLQEPDYFSSLGNPRRYAGDDSSFLFLSNPNSLDGTGTNKDTDANGFSNKLIFGESEDKVFGQVSKNRGKKPLFTFFNLDSDNSASRNSGFGSSARDDENTDRVISDIIRVVPSRERDNGISDTPGRFPESSNQKPRSNFGNNDESNGGGWTVIKPKIIGATRKIPSTSRDDDTSTRGREAEILTNSPSPDRFPVTSTTTKPLFTFHNFIRDQSVGDPVKKSGQKEATTPTPRGSRGPGTPHPLNSIYKRGTGNTVSSSVTTILSGVMTALMLYYLIFL